MMLPEPVGFVAIDIVLTFLPIDYLVRRIYRGTRYQSVNHFNTEGVTLTDFVNGI